MSALPEILVGIVNWVAESAVVRGRTRISSKNHKNPEMTIPIPNPMDIEIKKMKIKKIVSQIICILFFITNVSCNLTSSNENIIVDEKAEVQMVIDKHINAVNTLDVDVLISLMTDDHIEMLPNTARIVGKEAYREYFANMTNFFKSLQKREQIFVPDEFVVSGDWAFQIGTYSSKFTFPNGYIIEDEGNYTWLFKKDFYGEWKWARVISNSIKKPE